jgi:ferritin-like metal-binding protein YciE
MTIHSLQELFVEELKDIYDAEHQLIDALPKMAAGVVSPTLRTAFTDHLKQTRDHIKRLEQVFKAMDMQPTRKPCKAMQGLVKEGDEMLDEDADDIVKDAGLIAAAQRVEHYEMAGYGTLRTFAYVLGFQDVARLLQQTLDEEETTDKKLSQIANDINIEALGEQ